MMTMIAFVVTLDRLENGVLEVGMTLQGVPETADPNQLRFAHAAMDTCQTVLTELAKRNVDRVVLANEARRQIAQEAARRNLDIQGL
jgi:hypothetical protein